MKFDGCRGQLRVHGDDVCLRTRPGRDCSQQFPEIVAAAGALDLDVVLDGEVVCFDRDGHPDFAALRRRLVGADGPEARFVAFDVLHCDGQPLLDLHYVERRDVLEGLDLGPAIQAPRWFYADEAEHVIRWTRAEQLEGIVAKRLDGRYMPGRRSAAWVKSKHRRTERFVITGWVPDGERGMNVYLLARRTAVGLEPAGTASLGLHGGQRERLNEALVALERPGHRRRRVRRVEPRIHAEVSVHGSPEGPARDAVIRRVHLAP